MSKMVFPDKESMTIDELRQHITAVYRDDQGFRILVQFNGRTQPLNISDESGEAIWTAVEEDGYIDTDMDIIKEAGVGVAVTWTLRPNCYGRLLTVSDGSSMAAALGELKANFAYNPMRRQPRGRQQRVAGVQ